MEQKLRDRGGNKKLRDRGGKEKGLKLQKWVRGVVCHLAPNQGLDLQKGH